MTSNGHRLDNYGRQLLRFGWQLLKILTPLHTGIENVRVGSTLLQNDQHCNEQCTVNGKKHVSYFIIFSELTYIHRVYLKFIGSLQYTGCYKSTYKLFAVSLDWINRPKQVCE